MLIANEHTGSHVIKRSARCGKNKGLGGRKL
ncbi:hypothetical protein ACHAWC_009827 [Mediolabrus comicus]